MKESIEQTLLAWKAKAMEPSTFCGCEASEEISRFTLFGAPFDGATSFRPGARFAPQEMRDNSWGLETYSPRLDRDLEDILVADLGDLALSAASSEEALARVEAAVSFLLEHKKIPVMIGGDHSMTLGAIRAVFRTYPDLHVVHFDAHTDLRDSFYDNPLSHACVIRRAYELLGDQRIHSFGIRAGLREEFLFARRHLDFHPFSLKEVSLLSDAIGKAPVYVTIDLDVLDPSLFPGTGTPEPDGVSFAELMYALSIVGELNVIGTDLMELSPPRDVSGASTVTACKVLREWLLMIQ